MQYLRVTLVQANQIWEDKEANFKNYQSLLAETDDTDLIVLPEMFNTGFSMNAENLAENYTNSKSIQWLKKLAHEKNAAVYTSLMIEENRHFYNRGVFVLPDGQLQYYDKRKAFGLAGEDKIFQTGKSSTIIEYKNWKINLQICYDLRFPEICLNYLNNEVANYDLLLYVANWPEKRITHWNSLLVARAIENQSYVVGVNRFGVDPNNLNYNGDSKIIDPLGEVRRSIKAASVETIILDFDKLQDVRKRLPFLKDRNC